MKSAAVLRGRRRARRFFFMKAGGTEAATPHELASSLGMEAATPQEQWRFYVARKQCVSATTEMLQSYLQWRAETLPLPPSAPRIGNGLPDWMCFHGHARDRTPICHVNGAMYDRNVATPEQYADAAAQLFDDSLPRESLTKVTVLLDVRGDAGWANSPVHHYFPLIRTMAKLLGDNFPERLNRLIVYPVPSFGMAIWRTVKPWIDDATAQKICLLPGSAKRGAPCPVELAEHVEYAQIRSDRQHRHKALLHARVMNRADSENIPPHSQQTLME